MRPHRPALTGDNPDSFTVLRRLIAAHIGTITIVVSLVVGMIFEKEITPYVRYEGQIVSRVLVYGTLTLFCTLSLLAQATVVRRGRFINHLAAYITVRGGQQFVDRWGKMLARKSLANPASVPKLDTAYPSIRYLVQRAGYTLPPHYASLL